MLPLVSVMRQCEASALVPNGAAITMVVGLVPVPTPMDLQSEKTPSTSEVAFAETWNRKVGGVWAAPVLEQKSTSTSGSEIGGSCLLTLKPN